MDLLVFGFDSDMWTKYVLPHFFEELALLLFRVSTGIPTKKYKLKEDKPMTKEEIIKRIVDGELFKTIDQSGDINTFIHERENMIGVKVTEDPEYQRLREKRRQMEAEFESLYLEPAIGKEKTMAYNDLIIYIIVNPS